MKKKIVGNTKCILLLIILWGWQINPIGATGIGGDTLKVMSWNIRLDTPNDGEHQWKFRRDGLSSEIVKQQPDFLGVQEALFNQMKDLKKRLKGYKPVGVGRDDGKKSGEFSALFYKKRNLKLIRSGTFWLSETPGIAGSRGWDAACNRVATWAEFEIKKTGRHFVALNTHFDHVGDIARVESARLIVQRLGSITGRLPVIMTGDLNVTSKDKTFRILTFSENEVTLADTRNREGSATGGPDYSFVGFSPEFTDYVLIDFVLASWDFETINSSIFDFRPSGKYLSDHLPVITVLKFRENP